MKNIYALLLSSVLLFSSCERQDDDPPPPAAETQLQLTIKDGSGAVVPGATVKLYRTQSDYDNRTEFATQTTNASGVALFGGVNPIKYWWRVTNGCMDNSFNISNSAVAIPVGVLSNFDVRIDGVGYLWVTNNIAGNVRVELAVLPGIPSIFSGATDSVKLFAGAYNVRIVQISGAGGYDVNFVANIPCGGRAILTVP